MECLYSVFLATANRNPHKIKTAPMTRSIQDTKDVSNFLILCWEMNRVTRLYQIISRAMTVTP
jgi:hypothetical protein